MSLISPQRRCAPTRSEAAPAVARRRALPRGPTSSLVPRDGETTAATIATPSGEDVGRVPRTERRPPVKLRAGSTERVGKPWRSWRFPTACPHSALSRPHRHHFCNNDSSERRRLRLQPVPGLLRHPRHSVYGTIRSNRAGIPREKARNNNISVGASGTIRIRLALHRVRRYMSHGGVEKQAHGVSVSPCAPRSGSESQDKDH